MAHNAHSGLILQSTYMAFRYTLRSSDFVRLFSLLQVREVISYSGPRDQIMSYQLAMTTHHSVSMQAHERKSCFGTLAGHHDEKEVRIWIGPVDPLDSTSELIL